MRVKPYSINPDDPRAPPQEVWDRLTPEERERIVNNLPSEFSVTELLAKIQLLQAELEVHRAEVARLREQEARLREEVERRLAEEMWLREQEAQRREQAELRLAEVLAELDRLRKGRS